MNVLEVSEREVRVMTNDEFERYFTPAILDKIDKSLKQVEEGKVTKAMDKEELLDFLDSL